MPVFFESYQEYTYKNKWKKIYAEFNQVARQIAYDYDNDDFSEIVDSVRGVDSNDIHQRNDALNTIFSKYLQLF